MTHEIEIKAVGPFSADVALVESVGESLDAEPGMVDPIVSANVKAGTIEVNVEVEAASEAEARGIAAAALGRAMVAAGVVDGWTIADQRQAAIA